MLIAIAGAVAFGALGLTVARNFERSLRFGELHPGMDMRSVEACAGPPQEVSTNASGMIRWNYARWLAASPGSVYFGTNGRIESIR